MAPKRNQPYRGNIKTKRDPLDALFGEDDDKPPVQEVVGNRLPLKSIKLPAEQPRRYFDPDKLNELAESIKERGVLEPLLVRPVEGGYELVAGERRYRASEIAGEEDVPVVVHELDDEQAYQVALIENLQREDLNPVEETEGVLQLLSLKLGVAVDEVISLLYRMTNQAKGLINHNVMVNEDLEPYESGFDRIKSVFAVLGIKWESFVSNRLPLRNLPEEILEALRSGKIAYTKAQAIARIKDPDQRQQLLEDAIAGDWSLSQIKEKIAALRSTPKESEESDTSTLFESAKLITSFLKKKRTLEPQKQKRAEELMAELRSLFSGE